MNLDLAMAIEGMAILVMCSIVLLAYRQRNMGWVDVGWTAGVGLAAIMAAVAVEGYLPRRIMVAAMAVIWAGRLAGYIISDRVRGRPEDGRYKALRAHWGKHADRNFFFFCQAQTVLVVLFALPLAAAMSRPESRFTVWDAVGVGVWILAMAGELVADRQLRRFRSAPGTAGTTCRSGLWRYSRHPNYFFEWLHWWAYVVMLAGNSGVWVALTGPAFMLLFLYKVTGIPHTERQALRHRADYADYQKTTSAFIPWIPKRPAEQALR